MVDAGRTGLLVPERSVDALVDALLLLARDRTARLRMGEEARRQAESVDFLQELFVEVIEGFERAGLKDERGFVRWATRIARNNIRDRVRRRRERALESFSTMLRAGGPGAEGERPSERAMEREEVERLIEGLEGLKPDDQRVIELRDFEGLPFREIARRMGRPSEAAGRRQRPSGLV